MQFSGHRYMHVAGQPPPLSDSRTVSSPQIQLLYPLNGHSPLPQPLATTDLLSVSMVLPILHIFYKWNHIICGSLCLTSFSYHNVSRLILCSMRVSVHHSILWLNIPFYVYTTFYLSVHPLMGIWLMGLLTIVNNASISNSSITVHSIFSRVYK